MATRTTSTPAKKAAAQKTRTPEPDLEVVDDEYDVDEEFDTGIVDEYDDLADVPEALQFTATVDDDSVDDEAGPLDITIDGIKFTLIPPSQTALSLRYAEYNAAETTMDQALALLGIISTAMDRAGYVYLRQNLLAPRQSGRRFNENLLADLVNTILERWAGGEEIQRDQDKPVRPARPDANRAQRRGTKKRR
ncbi:MAG: hypothetical protein QM658_03095 [Gordonia sp. (in: high G+C Gram-positive bacteria)]